MQLWNDVMERLPPPGSGMRIAIRLVGSGECIEARALPGWGFPFERRVSATHWLALTPLLLPAPTGSTGVEK